MQLRSSRIYYFLLICTLFLLFYYYGSKMSMVTLSYPLVNKTYLTVPLSEGRLANQLFHLFDGFCAAKLLHRQFYVTYNANNSDSTDAYLEQVNHIFPRMHEMYELLYPQNVYQSKKATSTSEYLDPFLLQNVTDQYVVFNAWYGQNWNYFNKCEQEVRSYLTFSRNIVEYGNYIIENKNLNTVPSYLCVHIRRADFKKIKLETTKEVTLALLEHVIAEKNLNQIVLFGDDRTFMRDILLVLDKNNLTQKKSSFVSTFSEGTDFYLASKICHSFIIANPVSTFGFWMAYLIPNQKNVYYYYKEGRFHGKDIKKDIFPDMWTPLQIINGTDILSTLQ